MEEGTGDPVVSEAVQRHLGFTKPELRYAVCYVEKGRTEQPSWFKSLSRLHTDRAEAEQAAEALAEKHPDDLMLVVPVALIPTVDQAVLPGHLARKAARDDAERKRREEAQHGEAGLPDGEPGGADPAPQQAEPAGPAASEPDGAGGAGTVES